jgi:xylulokinase
MNCTGSPEEIRATYQLPREEIESLAADVPAGCGSVHMMPYFAGERTPPWPHARGALLGLQPGHLQQPGLMYRAALEAVSFGLADGLQRLLEFGVQQPSSVQLVGGGARSALWQTILANLLQIPIELPDVAESAASGAALQAAAVWHGADLRGFVRQHRPACMRVVEPDTVYAQTYADALGRHRDVSARLFASQ